MTFTQDAQRLADRGLRRVVERTETYDTGDYPNGLTLSYRAADSDLKPEILVVKSIQELKELCGMPDDIYRSGKLKNVHDVPPPPSSLDGPITNPTDVHLCAAISCYLYGNSTRVEDYAQTINELRFPLKIVVFSGKSVTVQPGHPLKVTGTDERPFGLFFDTITVESGGLIETSGPGKLACGTLAFTSSTSNVAQTGGTIIQRGGDAGNAGNGSSPGQSGPGTKGSDGTGDKHSCTKESGTGGKGRPGGPGGDASEGPRGGDAGEVNLSVDELTGTLTVGSIGGNGGNGGDGGTGGKGGPGGPGGKGHTTSDSHKNCANGPQGPGGDGGNGGNGMPGGRGGDGKNIYINWQKGNPTINVSPDKSKGGNGGNAGQGGEGGPGIPQGSGGQPGKSAPGGQGGKAGQLILNGPNGTDILTPPNA